MDKYINFIGMYCVQAYQNDKGRVNVHATVGSTRGKGGYNYEMNLPATYKEIVPQWKASNLKVTKKYLRLSEGLTFSFSEHRSAVKKLESKLTKLNKQ